MPDGRVACSLGEKKGTHGLVLGNVPSLPPSVFVSFSNSLLASLITDPLPCPLHASSKMNQVLHSVISLQYEHMEVSERGFWLDGL